MKTTNEITMKSRMVALVNAAVAGKGATLTAPTKFFAAEGTLKVTVGSVADVFKAEAVAADLNKSFGLVVLVAF